ncbi:Actin-depolymerizing factor 6-like protein [Drosera capensis]
MHRYVVFEIDEQNLEVIVEKTGGPEESYDDFTASLPEEDCRFAVYDFEFVTSENYQKSRIFFVACYRRQDLAGDTHKLVLKYSKSAIGSQHYIAYPVSYISKLPENKNDTAFKFIAFIV